MGLKNKYIKVVFTLLLTLILFWCSVYYQNKLNDKEVRQQFYVASKSIDKGKKIEESDLSIITTSFSLNANYVSDKSKLIGKYATTAFESGEFLIPSRLSDSKQLEEVLENERIITLPLKPEAAVAWQIEIGDDVEIVYTPNNTNVENISNLKTVESYKHKKFNVVIVDYYNDALVSVNSSQFTGIPAFITIKAKTSDADFIANSRDLGRFDLIVK